MRTTVSFVGWLEQEFNECAPNVRLDEDEVVIVYHGDSCVMATLQLSDVEKIVFEVR